MLLKIINGSLLAVKIILQAINSESICREAFIMDGIPCSQNSSTTKKQSESTCKKGWKHVLKVYQAYDTDKYRKKIQNTVIKLLRNYGYNIVEPGRFAEKYHSTPYHLFFSRIDASKETHNQQHSITFPEILDRSLGEIVNSLHLNFIVDITWLCLQYVLAGQRTDMMILYGDRLDRIELDNNITTIKIEKPSDFGCHHAKIMILQYHNGIRIVVSTANLFHKDWENKTQGLWISPLLPQLPKSADPSEGESPTNFKKDLGRYLSKYKNPALQQWIKIVKKTNFLDVNVFLVASVPGCYTRFNAIHWGYRKLSRVLSRHATLPANAPEWSLVAQSSSIGSLGPNYDNWLSKEIVFSMSRESAHNSKLQPKFQFIYPSLRNYKRSYDYIISTPCLSYSQDVHSRQKWIESYLYQWRAKGTGRDLAMPHIKSYTRISPDLESIPWFLLTSANLSKAAWGLKRNNRYQISNYEAGVIFLPKFITGTTTFPIKDREDLNVPIFPILHDLPLHRYNKWDTPLITRKSTHNWH